MISMPKAAFDAIHMLVTQLAQGLDQLKQSVEAQAGGQQPPADGAPAPAAPVPPQAGAGGAPEPDDDDFLKGLAQEGNKR